MREIAARGELDALVSERVWQETQRALEMPAPARFFEVLRDANAAVIFPELYALFGVPQPERWHPEIDSGVHTLMVLEQAAAERGPGRAVRGADARSRQGHDSAERVAAPHRARAARRRAGRGAVRSAADSQCVSRACVLVSRYHLDAHRVDRAARQHAARAAGTSRPFRRARASSSGCWRAKRTRADARD